MQKCYQKTIVTQSGKSLSEVSLYVSCHSDSAKISRNGTDAGYYVVQSKPKQKKETESKISLLSGLPQNKITTAFRREPT